MFDIGSFWRGTKAMTWKHGKVNYAIRRLHGKLYHKFWIEVWTPTWHEGRGPYISIGLGFISFYRGY